jgi:hypothetical protein
VSVRCWCVAVARVWHAAFRPEAPPCTSPADGRLRYNRQPTTWRRLGGTGYQRSLYVSGAAVLQTPDDSAPTCFNSSLSVDLGGKTAPEAKHTSQDQGP